MKGHTLAQTHTHTHALTWTRKLRAKIVPDTLGELLSSCQQSLTDEYAHKHTHTHTHKRHTHGEQSSARSLYRIF